MIEHILKKCYNCLKHMPTSTLRSFQAFLHDHDDLPAFHAGYLVLTFLIATMLNLGAFALLIVAHMCIDYIKYTEKHGLKGRKAFIAMAAESMVDVTILTIGLVLGIYLHAEAGIVATSGILRSGAEVARMLGLVIPKLEVLHRSVTPVMHGVEHGRELQKKSLQQALRTIHWNLVILAAALFLIAIAPLVVEIDLPMLGSILEREIIPWRM